MPFLASAARGICWVRWARALAVLLQVQQGFAGHLICSHTKKKCGQSGKMSNLIDMILQAADIFEQAAQDQLNLLQHQHQPTPQHPLPPLHALPLGSNRFPANMRSIDPITLNNNIPHDRMVYLSVNAPNGKVHHVYDYNSIKHLVNSKPANQLKSPITKRPFGVANVRKAYPPVDVQKAVKHLRDAAAILGSAKGYYS